MLCKLAKYCSGDDNLLAFVMSKFNFENKTI